MLDGPLNEPAEERSIELAEAELGFALPADYKAFIRIHNGGEGFLKDGYLIIWRIEEVASFNQEYEVSEYAPGIVLFGSSGGGEGYGWDISQASMPVVRVPFIGMGRDVVVSVSQRFSMFVEATK